MRFTRTIVAGMALAATAAVVLGTTGPAATASRMPVVPASAGHLTVKGTDFLWARGHAPKGEEASAVKAASTSTVDTSNDLVYGGGSGAGNVSQTPAVYLVFWGSQWSTTDPLATYLQAFMRGLYGTGDDWTTVSRQYCEGVAAGTVSCPTGAPHVGVPSGALVKGVWFDNASPATPISAGVVNIPAIDQIGAEAVRAAAHFGNTSAASNTQAQYVVATPSGFFTPGYGAYYCAYHSSVSSNYGSVAYTNLPYMTDLGASCGQYAVNSNGTYDGVSIVEGHEFMETVTDMRPSTGWTDSSGQENGDKCAWISSGRGAMTNLTLSTGTFAVQSTWDNSYNGGSGGCTIHAGQ